jgi:hypothetical protein
MKSTKPMTMDVISLRKPGKAPCEQPERAIRFARDRLAAVQQAMWMVAKELDGMNIDEATLTAQVQRMLIDSLYEAQEHLDKALAELEPAEDDARRTA